MAITVGTYVQRDDGWLEASVSQSVAGAADVILAAVASQGIEVKLIEGTMSAAGTLSLLSDAVPLIGTLDLLGSTPFKLEGLYVPINTGLKLTTVTGAFRGRIVFRPRAKLVLA